MPKVPATQTPVNRPPRLSRPTRTLRLVGRSLLIAAVVVAFAATTGAAVGPDSSQVELIMYSLGSALAIIMAIKIVIKLFVYIVQTAVVLASLGLLYGLVRIIINAISGN